MYIERIRIEEGFLDGLDVALVPGLNVIIGARGTGKTSLIELVRFCLGVNGYSQESDRRSRDHALSVLGAGQITVSLSDGEQKVTVSRSAADEAPRVATPFVPPIIFSQTEIESVGLQAGGRLRLLDGFINDWPNAKTEEIGATSEVRSLTAEAEALRREIDELRRQVDQIPALDKELAELAPAEQGVAKVSTEAAEKKKRLDALSGAMASASVAAASVDRFKQAIGRWAASLRAAIGAAPIKEAWPDTGGSDLLVGARSRVQNAHTHLRNAIEELRLAEAELAALVANSANRRNTFEEQAHQLRREIDELQKGAGSIIRRGQQLRERKAQLESLRKLLVERSKSLEAVIKGRGVALDALDSVRENRYKLRAVTASQLNKAVGPRIRVTVTRAGQFDMFSAALADVLRGSGLRYADLSLALAEHISPRELLEAADDNEFELLEDAVGISKDRAARALAHLREADLGALGTIPVEDSVAFELLDGSDYKDIAALSTGQRCTVVLPLVLRHTERILVVDQPEDHIDNAFIVDTLIRSVLARDPKGQIVFSTHNANIPVLGNADRVIQLGSDGRRGFVVIAAPLEDRSVVSSITTIMEGGAEAFERRASFYSRHRRR